MECSSDQSVDASPMKTPASINPATNDLPLEFNSNKDETSATVNDHTSDLQEGTSGRKRKDLPRERDRNDESTSTVTQEISNGIGGSISWNVMMTPNINPNMPPPPFHMMSPVPTDPSMLAMVGMPNFNQFPFMDPSMQGVMPMMSALPIKEVIHCTNFTLIPPPPPNSISTFGPTHKRPLGCKTVFVGGLPDSVTEAMMREIFERCGPINIIRMSKKKFCHIRFESEEYVENALFFSGYRMRIGIDGDNPSSGRLHVDYAEAREDQYEWECNQRALQREMRHRERMEQERLRPLSPPQIVHYTEREALLVIEKLRIARGCNNSLSEAVNILTKWLERGECIKKSAGMFYSLIQGTNSHVRRLINEKSEHEDQLSKARKLFNEQMNTFITQFDQIEKVFTAACRQKVWDHFTKAQRKNIETWRKQMQEAKKAHLDQIWNERGEAEMDLSDEEDTEPASKLSKSESTTNIVSSSSSLSIQYQQLEEENDILKCQNEAYKNEIDLNESTYKKEIETKDKQIKLLQQALQGMQRQLMILTHKFKNKKPQGCVPEGEASIEDDIIVHSNSETKQNNNNALHYNGDAHDDNISALLSVSSSPAEIFLKEDHIRLIGYLSSFLLVHPCGASLEYIWSYLQSQKLVSTLVLSDIEHFMLRFPNVRLWGLYSPSELFQLISCDKSGIVILWDFEDGILLKKYDISSMKGIETFNVSPATSRWLVVAQESKRSGTALFSISSKTLDKSPGKVSYYRLMSVDPDHKKIAIGFEGKYFAGVFDNNICTCTLPEGKKQNWGTGPRPITCIATHPKEYCIAVGDSTGRIVLWHNFLCNAAPVFTVYHWHTLPVSDISFSSEGSHFYSGGGECVLVMWRLNSDAKKDRRFLPRIGMPISHVTVSPNNFYVATSHVDNAIHLVNSHNCIEHVFQGLTQGHQWVENIHSVGIDRPVPTGLLFDPKSKALVLNGKPGHLQFYSLSEDKQLYNLDVVGENYLTQERHTTIINTDVVKAAFDSSGNWLATVEYRNDGIMSEELCLKFWNFNSTSQRFRLNTTIDHPHKSLINELMFKPTSHIDDKPMAMTISHDTKFKLWSIVDNPSYSGDEICWTCCSVGYFQSFIPKCASFSTDGSLLAVGFSSIVTLWQPEGNIIKAKLAHQRISDDVTHVEFGQKNCCHLVVVATLTSLTVWNFLSQCISWHVQLNITHLISDPFSDLMCTFTKDKKVFIFRPSDTSFVYKKEKVLNTDILHCAFIPHRFSSENDDIFEWEKHSVLIVMDVNQQIYSISKHELRNKRNVQMKMNKTIPDTPFSLLIAEKIRNRHPVNDIFQNSSFLHKKPILEFVQTPANVLPPPSNLCGDFINLLINPCESSSY
ncbi:Ecto-NOX disulfide-thiol exchanger 1 [Nymphon striatum]|nr:Ecto-NOX disulfide-thiol exchanger 1 [Nymphon striatum]